MRISDIKDQKLGTAFALIAIFITLMGTSITLFALPVFPDLLAGFISIFFLAFLPQFISVESANPLADIVLLGGVFVAMTFIVFVAYGQIASFVRNRVLASETAMSWIRRVTALAFGAIGLRLALDNS